MRQGFNLSSWLFNVFLDTIVTEARRLHGKSDFREENVDVLLFADDMVLIAVSAESLEMNLTHLFRIL